MSTTLSEESNLEMLVADARRWADTTTTLLKQEVSVDTGAGRDSIENYAWSRKKTVSVSFQFLRYLIMIEKGAGRNYGGKKGATWLDREGKKHKTNPNSLGKAGTGERKAMPWFNPVLKREIGTLADAAAEHYVIEVKKILIR